MADPVKRLHYFDKQFLREQDFIDEQNYHIQRQRDHNRLLHTPGIAQGLEIPDPPSGSTGVTVNAGIAYDNQGREIVLADDREINLESFTADRSVYLAIAYAEQETDPSSKAGVIGNTRWTEAPAIEPLLPNTNGQFPEDSEEKIILAKVNRNGNQIATIDRTERRAAGVVGNGNIKTPGLIRGSSMPPNLIGNSYMNILDDDDNNPPKPAGYSVRGNVTLEAAHPFTKGFEGPYVETKPANAAESVDDATEENPYWFGEYNKGARIKRGGLADGWGSFRDGRILKITGDNSEQHTVVLFPFESGGNFLTKKVHLKAWLKISSGKQVEFGEVAGWYTVNSKSGLIITKEQSDNAPDGWYRVDGVIRTSEVTGLGGQSFSMGIAGDDADGSFEVYLALPYLANLDYDTWLPSVSDMLSRDGLTVHPSSSNVGIGTTNPQAKLEVNGNVRVTGTLTKGSGSFLIDHPLEPFNKTLRHNFVESPEDLCLYRGKVTLNSEGSATVKMPDYFAALTKEEEATVNLTPIGKKPFFVSYEWSPDCTEFEVFGEPNAKVAYLVLADRDDPAIHQLRKPVEEEKGNGNFEQGKLLYPEAYGYPKKTGVDYHEAELVADEKSQPVGG